MPEGRLAFCDGQKLLSSALEALKGLDFGQFSAVQGKLTPETVFSLLVENYKSRRFCINYWRLISEADNLRLEIGTEVFSAVQALNQSRCLMVIDLLRKWGNRELNAVLTLEDEETYLQACERIVKEVNEQISALGVLSESADLENFLKVTFVQKMDGYFRERRENLAAYRDRHTGLLTKDFTVRYVEQLIAQNIPTAVLVFDMTKLGPINEALEMAVTDRLLAKFFESLASAARSEDLFSWGKDGEEGPPSQLQRRQAGGDEGQLVFVGIDNLDDLTIAMTRIYEQMEKPVELEVTEIEWEDVVRKYQVIDEKRMAYEDAVRKRVEKSRRPEKLTTKEECALELIPVLQSQVEEQRAAGRIENYILKIKLGMRFGGMILDPSRQSVVEIKKILSYLEGLIGKAKALQQSGSLENPLIVVDQEQSQWLISAEDLRFRVLGDR